MQLSPFEATLPHSNANIGMNEVQPLTSIHLLIPHCCHWKGAFFKLATSVSLVQAISLIPPSAALVGQNSLQPSVLQIVAVSTRARFSQPKDGGNMFLCSSKTWAATFTTCCGNSSAPKKDPYLIFIIDYFLRFILSLISVFHCYFQVVTVSDILK